MKFVKDFNFNDVEMIEFYRHGDFVIAIWRDEKNIEAWISRVNYGVAELMFGCPRGQHTPGGFRDLVEANLDEYMAIYDERYGEE